VAVLNDAGDRVPGHLNRFLCATGVLGAEITPTGTAKSVHFPCRAVLESPRFITLAAHQSLLLGQDEPLLHCLKLSVHEGIGRIAAGFSQPGGRSWRDVTLAFTASGDCPWLCLPPTSSCLLEAQTPLRCELEPAHQCPPNHDLIREWLLDLHLVRHPVGADLRLRSLL
jgi:hypothetical protein